MRLLPALLVLILSAAAQALDGCPQKDLLQASKGHFISASISWSVDRNGPPNSVIFEIVSTWRRNHTWPCDPTSPFTGGDQRPGLDDMVPIVGISMPNPDSTSGEQVEQGVVFSRLDTGDNRPGSSQAATYDLMLKVTSLSVEEDWISGVSYVSHTYSAPFASKQPFYPASYVATVGNDKATQPFQSVPWTATFSSCCRAGGNQEAAGKSFSFHVKVDLSDIAGSPRIVTLPRIWLPSTLTSERNLVYLCAVPAAGKASIASPPGMINGKVSSGPLAWNWGVVNDGVPVDAVFLPQSVSEGVSPQCRTLSLPPVNENSNTNIESVKVFARLGSAEATADIQVRVIPSASAAAASGMHLPTRVADPFGCSATDECQLRMSVGLDLAAALASSEQRTFFGSLSYAYHQTAAVGGPGLEVRYVLGRSNMQTSLLSTAPGRIRYTKTIPGADNSMLPGNGRMSPQASLTGLTDACDMQVAACPSNDQTTRCKYVTGVGISFSSSAVNARPLHNVPVSSEGRDYAATVANGDAQVSGFVADGYKLVEGSNFNEGKGGATVGLWLERQVSSEAITDVRLVNASQVSHAMADGFEKLDQNLIEQSERGEIFMMYKKGSGAPIIDIRTTPPADCLECYECDMYRNGTTQGVTMRGGYMRVRGESRTSSGVVEVVVWVKRSSERHVRRNFAWTPCTGEEDDWVLCAQGAQSSGGYLSTPQQCMLIRVDAKKPPVLMNALVPDPASDLPDAHGVYTAQMGKKLRIQVDVRQVATRFGEPVRVEISGSGGGQGEAPAAPQGMYMSPTLHGDMPAAGADVYLRPSGDGDNPSLTQTRGFIVWTPMPHHGGWNGSVCVHACTSGSGCSAGGGSSSTCSVPKCFRVRVERCKWKVQSEESFISIAPKFQTSWLQLWYSNPLLKHPDFPFDASSSDASGVINVGRTFKTRPDDTAESVSSRFGMSNQRLYDLNADIAMLSPGQPWPMDQVVCVIPDSCSLEDRPIMG